MTFFAVILPLTNERSLVTTISKIFSLLFLHKKPVCGDDEEEVEKREKWGKSGKTLKRFRDDKNHAAASPHTVVSYVCGKFSSPEQMKALFFFFGF